MLGQNALSPRPQGGVDFSAVDSLGDNPNIRRLRRECPTHGWQHADFTQADDGKLVELRCMHKECAFRRSFEIRWPDAFHKRLTPV